MLVDGEQLARRIRKEDSVTEDRRNGRHVAAGGENPLYGK
jgi:hypothetical protein